MSDSHNGWVTAEQLGDIMRARGLERMAISGVFLPEQYAAYKLRRESEFCLARNRGGERLKCTDPRFHNCGGYHEFLTLMGVDRPWRGLDGALYGYTTVTRDERVARLLERYGPELASSHPDLARGIEPQGLGSLIAVSIALTEPIGRQRALELLDAINVKMAPSKIGLSDL